MTTTDPITNLFKLIIQFLLKWFARVYLWRIKPYIIVIAGTTGRHWIKEAVRDALKEKNFPVRANIKNFNAEIGLPLSILGLASDEPSNSGGLNLQGESRFCCWIHILWRATKKAFRSKPPILKEFLVLEMAIDRPKGINYLLSIVKPQTLILTTVTMIYAENFENLDEIALEYRKLVKSLPWNGLVVLNFDDERIKNLAESSDKRVIGYGFSKEADFQAKNVRKVSDGQKFEINVNQHTHQCSSTSIKINRFGNHHIYAALVKEIIKESFKISAPDFFRQIRE